MRVEPEQVAGVGVVVGAVTEDDRGRFAKAASDGDLGSPEFDGVHRQLCSARNSHAGTVRGMHLQARPYVESKLVWCVAGAVLDVLVDCRPGEPTYGDWAAMELSDAGGRALRVPPGVAHGYQTLTDDTVVVYLIDGRYSPEHALTLSCFDDTVAIAWPREVSRISERDRTGTPWPIGF